MDRQRQQPPFIYRLIRDASGQTETIGMVLILGLVIMGTTVVVAFGSTAVTDLRQSANAQRVSHSMTQLDSQTAMVALGDSPRQTIDLTAAGQSGKFTVDEGAGRLIVRHINHSGGGDTEEIYNETLGALVYQDKGDTVVYQGGGVWRRTGNGSAVMVSPPEFHYRGDTLTLPVIGVHGDGTALGANTVSVKKKGNTTQVFRNSSETYDTGPKPYENPIENGSISITVRTNYTQAWADYFRSRTDGAVTVHNNGTVQVLLQTLGVNGDFGELPEPGSSESIKIQGLTAHQIENFTVNFDLEKSASPASMKFFVYAVDGNQEWGVAFVPDTSTHKLDVAMYYDRDTTDGIHQIWEVTDAYQLEGSHPDHDAVTVNLTDETMNMTYGPPTSNYPWNQIDDPDFDGPSGSVRSLPTHDQHPPLGTPPEPSTFGTGSETTVNYLTNHYLSLMGPNFEIKTGDKGGAAGNNNAVTYDKTTGNISYGAGEASFIKFLHVTENNVTYDFED